MNITFIGGGNMASALIGGLIRKGHTPRSLHVVEPQEIARARLAQEFSVSTSATIDARALVCDCLVLAVKPQHMLDAIAPLAGSLGSQVVVSIAAGTRLETISTALGGYSRLIRAMPNTPALIGEGVTGLYAGAGVTAAERVIAQTVMQAAGLTVWVDREDKMDAITAISGSGPAYVFYFIEALEKAATEIGFDEATARTLALQTFKGAALLAAQSAELPGQLRERVTSPGGTTEAAIQSMIGEGVQESIVRGAKAALARAQTLGAK